MKKASSNLTQPGTEIGSPGWKSDTLLRHHKATWCMREVVGSSFSWSKVYLFWVLSPFLLHLVAQYGSVLGLRAAVVRARAASSRGTVKCVPAQFQVDLGINLIKQRDISQVDRSA